MLKNNWSRRDEEELACLLARKKAFESEARAPLEELVREFDMRPDPDYNNVIDRLIIRADEFRDALKPFDSRIRRRSAG